MKLPECFIREYTGSITTVAKDGFRTVSLEVDLGNPLQDLIFCEDSPRGYFTGEQKGNRLTISGFRWDSDEPGFPELCFINFSQFMKGKTVYLENPIVAEGYKTSSVIIDKPGYAFIPYIYDIELKNNKIIARDLAMIGDHGDWSVVETGKEYELTLTCGEWSATYYVTFTFDTSLIKRGSSYGAD